MTFVTIAKNLVLGLGILIVFMLVLGYGFSALYPSPEYRNYCKEKMREPKISYIPEYAQQCDNAFNLLQNKVNECSFNEGLPIFEYDQNNCPKDVKCDFCNLEYNQARDSYSNVVFVASLLIGVLVIIIGVVIFTIEPVGTALIASGIGAIIYGTIVNWRNFGDLWRFILLFIALVFLIILAIFLNKKKVLKKK